MRFRLFSGSSDQYQKDTLRYESTIPYDVYRRIRKIQRVPRDSNFSDEWLPSTLWIYLNKNEDDVPQWQSYMPTKVTIDWLDSKWCPVWTFNEYLYWLISEKAFWNTTILKFLQLFLYWSKHFQCMCFKKCYINHFIQWQSYMPTKVTIDWLDSKWCPVWTFNEYLYWLISEKAFWNTTILKFLQFFLYWSKHFQWMCFKKCSIHSLIN